MEDKKNDPIAEITDPVLIEGFSFLQLQAAVEKAAQIRRRRRNGRIFGSMLLVIGLSIAGWWQFSPRKLPDEPPTPVLPPTAPPSPPSAQPIAQAPLNQSTDRPDVSPAPVLRGVPNTQPDRNLSLIRLAVWPPKGLPRPSGFHKVDSLLLAGAVEEAYPLIQRAQQRTPGSDTLQWMRAWCLVRLGEGAAAQSEWQSVRSRHPEWGAAVDYYEALSVFLAGNTVQATTALSVIKRNKRHSFAREAAEALKVIGQ